jgi:dephospho-CoA kinase
MNVCLTGGICSGKSRVSNLFGVPIVDADVLARQLVEPGTSCHQQIREQFGGDYFAADGQLDRGRLRRRIFADAAARSKLEDILHPPILAEIGRWCQTAGGIYRLLVIPLLTPKNRGMLPIDRVLWVYCDAPLQLDRLRTRDQLSQEQALAVIRSQPGQQDLRDMADDRISNNLGLSELDQRVDEQHKRYLRLAGN